MAAPITLPWPFQRSLESATAKLLAPEHGGRAIDFTRPAGEPALVGSDSVSWRVFKNPVTLFVGGIAAVILELAEPRIRTAIWDHSNYRRDPLRRLRRTGLAAMVTVYGARSIAEPMIAGVARMHARVVGTTERGVAYSAADPQLITWVHATAAFGFAHAYSRFACPLAAPEIDRYFLEARTAARLYGSPDPPTSAQGVDALFGQMIEELEPSPAIAAFLRSMSTTPAFPLPLLWLQRLLVRAALELVPPSIRRRLDLEEFALRGGDLWMVSCAARLAEKVVLSESPAAQSCRRLGLAPSYLYASPA